MKNTPWLILFFFLSLMLFEISSCKHSPIVIDDDLIPIDTTDNPIDTTVVDTSGTPCDPDIVYFNLDILPILKSNCAFSGCHDAASAENGVILESYETTMQTADVEPFDLDESKLYRVIIETDEDKRMPRPPSAPLTASQINLIAKWILQGAENLECDPDAGVCDTEDVSFSAFVQPVIQDHCQGCHSGDTPTGGIDLTNHGNVKTIAETGRLYGAISWQTGYVKMPLGGDQLPQCTIDKFKSWIDAGSPDN
jgi:uncharacterized membrane protein